MQFKTQFDNHGKILTRTYHTLHDSLWRGCKNLACSDRFSDVVMLLPADSPLRKNHMKKPTCESRVKLEQHFTCDPHVVKTHVIHM